MYVNGFIQLAAKKFNKLLNPDILASVLLILYLSQPGQFSILNTQNYGKAPASWKLIELILKSWVIICSISQVQANLVREYYIHKAVL